MRWNQFGNDPARAKVLGEMLLGAALAGGPMTDSKLAVVQGQIAKALGASVLPPDVAAHLQRFDGVRFDLDAACHSLALDNARDRLQVMKAVSLVINAQGTVPAEARAYALRVATHLGVAWNDVLDLIGMPHRPTTGPRPRPSTR
jgi:hypothetical protein